jgi:hypothetical protein
MKIESMYIFNIYLNAVIQFTMVNVIIYFIEKDQIMMTIMFKKVQKFDKILLQKDIWFHQIFD